MSQALPPGPGGPQDVKLTEEEQKLVAKLFSDPTYFPLEFRTWLKNYIEGAGIMVTSSQVRGSGSSSDRTGLPAGLIIICGGTAAVPPDALACDGSTYLRSVQNLLFAKIGTTWGSTAGDNFKVPDFRDRSLFGIGAAIAMGATDPQAFGTRGGWRHRHTFTDGGTVGFNPNPGTGSAGAPSGDRSLQGVGGVVGPAGTNLDGVNWAGVIFAITTGKTA